MISAKLAKVVILFHLLVLVEIWSAENAVTDELKVLYAFLSLIYYQFQLKLNLNLYCFRTNCSLAHSKVVLVSNLKDFFLNIRNSLG